MQELLSRLGVVGGSGGSSLVRPGDDRLLRTDCLLAQRQEPDVRSQWLAAAGGGWRPDCAVTPSDFLNLEFVSLAALPWFLAGLLIFVAWRRGRKKTQS